MQTSLEEILHILVSVITISIAFSLFSGNFWLVLTTIGLGFILHELSHKIVAQSYGAIAFYRAWTFGLVIALGLAVVTAGRFVFAAPGAVVIYGAHLTREHQGKIAAAGPLMNFFLALGFLSLATASPGLKDVAFWGAYVNAFLGAFNMIPIFPLDGQKIKAWNEGAWALLAVALFALLLGFMFGAIPIG